jgi:hypothetical protein
MGEGRGEGLVQPIPKRAQYGCGLSLSRRGCWRMVQSERMTRDQIQTAIKEGIPFEIRMADGARYKVRERYLVAVGRTSIVVFDDHDLAHILPLLTMTGISYLKPNAKK